MQSNIEGWVVHVYILVGSTSGSALPSAKPVASSRNPNFNNAKKSAGTVNLYSPSKQHPSVGHISGPAGDPGTTKHNNKLMVANPYHTQQLPNISQTLTSSVSPQLKNDVADVVREIYRTAEYEGWSKDKLF